MTCGMAFSRCACVLHEGHEGAHECEAQCGGSWTSEGEVVRLPAMVPGTPGNDRLMAVTRILGPDLAYFMLRGPFTVPRGGIRFITPPTVEEADDD